MCELLELCVPLCICMLRTFQFGLLGIGCIFHAIDECCIKPCCPNCCREKKKAISQEDVRVSSLEIMDFHGLGYIGLQKLMTIIMYMNLLLIKG